MCVFSVSVHVYLSHFVCWCVCVSVCVCVCVCMYVCVYVCVRVFSMCVHESIVRLNCYRGKSRQDLLTQDDSYTLICTRAHTHRNADTHNAEQNLPLDFIDYNQSRSLYFVFDG